MGGVFSEAKSTDPWLVPEKSKVKLPKWRSKKRRRRRLAERDVASNIIAASSTSSPLSEGRRDPILTLKKRNQNDTQTKMFFLYRKKLNDFSALFFEGILCREGIIIYLENWDV